MSNVPTSKVRGSARRSSLSPRAGCYHSRTRDGAIAVAGVAEAAVRADETTGELAGVVSTIGLCCAEAIAADAGEASAATGVSTVGANVGAGAAGTSPGLAGLPAARAGLV